MVVYFPPYKTSFVGDDYLQLGYVAEFLDSPLHVTRVFNPLWTTWYFRPLQNVWLLFCRLLFGLNPFAYYYLQSLWHVVTGAALFAVAQRLGLPSWGAVFATALFLMNSHHHDVVAWISSISLPMFTALSLLAIVCTLRYIMQRAHAAWLLGAAVSAILAMLSHEEGLLLPLFLLLLRLTQAGRREVGRLELVLGSVLLLLSVGLGAVQFVRPNATIAFQGQSAEQWLESLHPQNVSEFVVTVLGRWLLLNKTVPGVMLTSGIMRSAALVLALAGGIGLAVGYGLWRGNKTIRLSLIWVILHLGFLYFAVWRQKPEFFAGRHLYASWAFASLTVATILIRPVRQNGRSATRVALILLTVVMGLNILLIGADQQAWQQHTVEVAAVEAQMKQLIPRVTPDTQIFAHRFVLLPSFVAHAAAVWYAEPGISGGSLLRLKAQEAVTQPSHLVDYVGGQLFNAFPGLQQFARSWILWKAPRASVSAPTPGDNGATFTLEQIAGPPHDRRMAIEVQPPAQGWLSLEYDVDAGAPTHLATAVLGEDGMAFRVRLFSSEGDDVVAHAETVGLEQVSNWQPLLVPLQVDGRRAERFRLEIRGPAGVSGYWSVPHLVQK